MRVTSQGGSPPLIAMLRRAKHVATAVFGRADVLLTNDDKIHGLGSFKGVSIRRPDWQAPTAVTR